MDREGLPRLETEEFASAGRIKAADTAGIKPAQSWRSRAAGLAERIGIPVREGREKPQGKEEPDAGYRRLLIKTGICAAIAVVILGISSINTPAANSITQTISDAVNHEFSIPDDIGRLKFVDNLSDEVQSVFSPLPDAAVVYPADGDIITTFGQAGSKGVRIVPDDPAIDCIARGTVTGTGSIGGAGYVTVQLDSGETAAFYNIDPSVEADDIVMPGQQIGTLSGDYLYLEMKSGDEFIDPMEFLRQGTTGQR